ncbi:cytochrome P450 2B6-like [Apostichopus japonicus]|uniref:cytochrome P450 2B6-like n=1 Tax=Stichopus japonicus TaxID=307972 RepID=UPI003AB3B256
MAPLGKNLHRVVVFVLKIVRRQHKTFVSTFSLLVLSFATIIWRQKSWKRLPPGPWGLPVVGILPHIMAVDNPGRKIRNMSQFYGQIFCARLGNHRAVFLNSLEMMKESIKQRERMFGIDEISHGLVENINFKFDLPSSNLTSDNQRQRRMIQNVLHQLTSEKTSQAVHANIVNGCQIVLEEIQKSAAKEHSLVDPAILLTYTIPNILMSIIFNIRFNLDDPDYFLFLEHFCQIQKAGSSSCYNRHSQLNVLDAFVSSMRGMSGPTNNWKAIALCMEKTLNMERDDISTAVEEFLTGVEKEDINALDSPFTMNLLLAYALTYVAEMALPIIASLTWSFLYIVKYPHVQENIHRELDRVVGRVAFVTSADFSKLPYLAAVLQESIRHSPLAYLSLQYLTESEIKLGSYTVPSDTFVFHNLWALLHDPKHYPVPHRFNPDRFLYNHRTFIEDERVRFVHFGRKGTRGESLSTPEIIRFLLFSNVLHQFSLSSPSNQEELSTEAEKGLVKFPKPYEVKFRTRREINE